MNPRKIFRFGSLDVRCFSPNLQSFAIYFHCGFENSQPCCCLKDLLLLRKIFNTPRDMDDKMIHFQENLVGIEIEAEDLLLARHQSVENDRLRNGNREALTALRRRARAAKVKRPTPFEPLMRNIGSTPLIKEVCETCGDHDVEEKTWMKFPGTDVFAAVPFHAAHTILEEDQTQLDLEAKTLQSFIKDKSLSISEKSLADKISPGVLRSLVTLKDERKF